jgi:two-component system NarL family sensor kinase
VTSGPPDSAPQEPAPAGPPPPGQAGAPGAAAGAPAPAWVVLVTPSAGRAADAPPSMRRMVGPLALAGLVLAIIVALAGGLVSQRVAGQQAVHDVAELTDDLAVSIVQPALTNSMPGDPAQARRVLDPLVRNWVTGSGSMVRVKIWTPSGMVLYSDEPRLIGQTFTLDGDARSALLQPRTEAGVSDLRLPENQYERGDGKLLEVYRPVWTPDGQPLLFETYFKYDTVSQRSTELWRGFAGVTLSSLLALMLLLAGLGWLVVLRARQARARQDELTRRALAASDDERRRIAATLHDGVVQQLVGASLIAAGHAQRAALDGDPDRAADLESAAATVRDGVAGLRSLLVDIYPPSLRAAGLASALRDLARTATGDNGVLRLTGADIDDVVADATPERDQEAMFRIAQEALRNAVRHAGASRITLRLAGAEDGRARLDVADDGRGFDAVPQVEGHFGLRLMADAARHGGGSLAIRTAPGAGTLVRYEASMP